MKKLMIKYHDGSVQICTPQQDGPNRFDGNWRLLAEHVAGSKYHSEHAYKSYEVMG